VIFEPVESVERGHSGVLVEAAVCVAESAERIADLLARTLRKLDVIAHRFAFAALTGARIPLLRSARQLVTFAHIGVPPVPVAHLRGFRPQ
jgi:hypothetical protein